MAAQQLAVAFADTLPLGATGEKNTSAIRASVFQTHLALWLRPSTEEQPNAKRKAKCFGNSQRQVTNRCVP